ncbi:phosphoketolase family protein [Actinokineospora bangkokensis]|uniref:Phosphoketolase n=1 Tax=Actinokineospora bangkokensis TaxID=1193682 RepID=A0A1Q9LLQ6_9PSEU|nr:phosphoketolase family protein [Actinokineospora bangkokensis]OLR92960.1 phosphoketolase [Actinokineospora bangkokensis]
MAASPQRYRRACDYLAAAMIYLRDNELLREPLEVRHLKPRLLGHWGTCPGITYLYAGLNRLRDPRTLLVTGPGHGAPAIHANLWLEGTHERFDPALSRDGAGLRELVRRFSWPGGFPSHLSPEVPGVVHEGGELGYALATAFGAVLDKPDLRAVCLVGDGEAETGPTAGSWHGHKFLDPARDGTVLPVLHLNGYRIAAPTVFGCMTDHELLDYFRGCGWSPKVVDATTAADPDELLAQTLRLAWDTPLAKPMIVMRTQKGWGAPAHDAAGAPLAGTFRAHQVPLANVHDDPAELRLLERWLRSYEPDDLFDQDGNPAPDLLEDLPGLGMLPEANGGALRRDLPLPDLAPFAAEGPASPTGTAGGWLAQLMRDTEDERDFRVVCPDELESNKLGAVLEATDRAFTPHVPGYSEHVSPGGRVMEVLSEHLCQGWLQGYLLTGRHGLFPCYEAFASIVDSMVNQHAKFLKVSAEVPWREPVASLNYLLSSEGWRQEHNGYSHQGPGFINNVLTKKASVARVYLPPDANSLLVVLEHCLASTGRINVVVAGKNEAPCWMDLDTARAHCAAGAGTWEWAGTGGPPQVVLGCAGGIPTVETLAAAHLLREHAPDLRVQVVNVVDLLALAPADRHPHGMAAADFDRLFPPEVPVVMGFHGYPSAVHEVLHGRADTQRFHVHGYHEEGTTTTPYDLLVDNGMSRHDLAADAVRRAGGPPGVVDRLLGERDRIRALAHRDGEDPAEITGWTWSA